MHSWYALTDHLYAVKSLNRLFRRRSNKTSKLRVTVLCEFPAEMASNAENVSIWWRHHEWNAIDKIISSSMAFKLRSNDSNRCNQNINGVTKALTHYYLVVPRGVFNRLGTGVAPVQRHVLTWTNVVLWSVRNLRTNFSWVWFEIQLFLLKQMLLKISFAQCCSWYLFHMSLSMSLKQVAWLSPLEVPNSNMVMAASLPHPTRTRLDAITQHPVSFRKYCPLKLDHRGIHH